MKNPYSSPQTLDQETRPRLTPGRWFMRLVAGLFWGWFWSCLVCAGWIGLATAAYGDISRASEAMTGRAWAPYVFGAAATSGIGSFVGGLVGPLSIGNASSRVRRPILISSGSGATFGALIGILAACVVMWISQQQGPRSTLFGWAAPGLSVLGGVLGGWLGGRVVLGYRPMTDDPEGNSS